MTADALLHRSAAHPLPAPPRRSRFLPWALFALIWTLSAGMLVAGAQVAAALGS